jgi:hypothetical protein
MLDILNCPPHIIDGTLNEIRPPVMELARDAREMLTSFGKEMQKYMLRIGRDNPLGEHVNKMPAISVRLAAILKLIEEGSSANLGAEHANVKWLLGADHLARGIALTRYFIKEKERLSEPGPVTQKLEDARLLLSWLREVGKTSFTRSEVYKNASKHRLRDKAVLDDVIALLMDYGHLQEIELPRKLGAAKAAKKYQLTEEGLDALHVEQIA